MRKLNCKDYTGMMNYLVAIALLTKVDKIINPGRPRVYVYRFMTCQTMYKEVLSQVIMQHWSLYSWWPSYKISRRCCGKSCRSMVLVLTIWTSLDCFKIYGWKRHFKLWGRSWELMKHWVMKPNGRYSHFLFFSFFLNILFGSGKWMLYFSFGS